MKNFEKIRLNVYSYEAIKTVMHAFHTISLPRIPFVDAFERSLFNDTELRNYVGVDESGEYYFLVELEHHFDLNLVKQICQLHLTYLQGLYKGTSGSCLTTVQPSGVYASTTVQPSGFYASTIEDLNKIDNKKLTHVLNHWNGCGTEEDESFVGMPFDPFRSATFKEKLDNFKKLSEEVSDPPKIDEPISSTWKEMEKCRLEILAMLGVPVVEKIEKHDMKLYTSFINKVMSYLSL